MKIKFNRVPYIKVYNNDKPTIKANHTKLLIHKIKRERVITILHSSLKGEREDATINYAMID